MDRGRQRMKSVDQRGCGCVEIFIADAIDASVANTWKVFPPTPSNNFFQRNSVSRAAPGGDQNIGRHRLDGWELYLRARGADELTTSRFHQLCDPLLRCNQRLAPFLA